ncbi:nucleotidyl transferase AbiEii/AbiGii toxin family protein [Candidatus Dependentiae bacterium]|nr:nucleotidyl transferase AbiEii/AbiGii toxin family protein [Candidatus Dependentiae bacterium]
MTLEIASHKNILVHVLKDIYTNLEIGPFLGFKGGTAAYLFYDLSRFSVDLDFDLLNEELEGLIFDTIKKILEEYGLVREARQKRYSFFYLLSYNDKIQNAYNIKVDINRRNFGSTYEIKNYLGIPMKVMVQEDMAAHKMVAMYERMGTTNRDIFDTWFFLKNGWPLNVTIIEKRTGLQLKEFLQKCIEELELMTDRGILSGLGELLDAKQKVWAKERLRKDTIFLLRLKINS